MSSNTLCRLRIALLQVCAGPRRQDNSRSRWHTRPTCAERTAEPGPCPPRTVERDPASIKETQLRALACVLLGALGLACEAGLARQDSVRDLTRLRAVNDAYRAAWLAGDS